MTFCAYWNRFWGTACTKCVIIWYKTLIKLSYQQAWTQKWFTEVVEILTDVSYNRRITASSGKLFEKGCTQPCLNFSFIEKSHICICNQ